MKYDNEELHAAAKKAVARLSDYDFALFLCGALDGEFDMTDDLSDIIYKNVGENMVVELLAYVERIDDEASSEYDDQVQADYIYAQTGR